MPNGQAAAVQAQPATPAIELFFKSASVSVSAMSATDSMAIWKKTISVKSVEQSSASGFQVLGEVEHWLAKSDIEETGRLQLQTLHDELTQETKRLNKCLEISTKCSKKTFIQDFTSGDLAEIFMAIAALVSPSCLMEILKWVAEKLQPHSTAKMMEFINMNSATGEVTFGELSTLAGNQPIIISECLTLQREMVHKIFEKRVN